VEVREESEQVNLRCSVFNPRRVSEDRTEGPAIASWRIKTLLPPLRDSTRGEGGRAVSCIYSMIE
jgi:hypothetical protein